MDNTQHFVKSFRIQDGLLCAFGFLITKWLIGKQVKGCKNALPLPPCPPRYPLVGNLPLSRSDMRQVFRKLTKEYGGIFLLHFGRKLMVVVAELEEAKEVFLTQGEAFSDRGHPPLIDYTMGIEG